eukprot:898904-Pleurochrysis_carterae.AAC.1
MESHRWQAGIDIGGDKRPTWLKRQQQRRQGRLKNNRCIPQNQQQNRRRWTEGVADVKTLDVKSLDVADAPPRARPVPRCAILP